MARGAPPNPTVTTMLRIDLPLLALLLTITACRGGAGVPHAASAATPQEALVGSPRSTGSTGGRAPRPTMPRPALTTAPPAFVPPFDLVQRQAQIRRWSEARAEDLTDDEQLRRLLEETERRLAGARNAISEALREHQAARDEWWMRREWR